MLLMDCHYNAITKVALSGGVKLGSKGVYVNDTTEAECPPKQNKF